LAIISATGVDSIDMDAHVFCRNKEWIRSD
jgi:hypothetical protein